VEALAEEQSEVAHGDPMEGHREALHLVGHHLDAPGVGGDGGHLSLVAGLMGDPNEASDTRIRAVVAYFPPTDLETLLIGRARQGAIDFPEEERGAVSPVRYVDANDLPVLLITGDADRGVPIIQSQRLKEELDRVGVEAKLVAFPGADHDFYVKGDPAKTDAYALEAMNMMVAWFEEKLN